MLATVVNITLVLQLTTARTPLQLRFISPVPPRRVLVVTRVTTSVTTSSNALLPALIQALKYMRFVVDHPKRDAQQGATESSRANVQNEALRPCEQTSYVDN